MPNSQDSKASTIRRMLEALWQNCLAAAQRFPVAVAASVGFTALALLDTRHEFVMAALFCTCFWSVAAVLFAESRNMSRLKAVGLSLAGSAALYAILHFSPHWEFTFALLGLAAFLAMGISPFLRSEANAGQMAWFCSELSRIIRLAALIALVVMVGGSAILASLRYLFGVPVHHSAYEKLLIVAAGLLAPIFAMGELPRDLRAMRETYTKREMQFYAYLLVPLLTVYAVILWLYALKIGITGDLPKGKVGYMVGVFSLGGLFVYLMTSGKQAMGHKLLEFWHRRFFLILLAPLGLLAVGVWVRIREYGLTEERYLLAAYALWLAVLALYVWRSRSARRPIVVYATAVLMLFASAFGPWGAQSLSERSQVARLEALLEKYAMLDAGQRIIPAAEQSLNKAEQAQIASIVSYLVYSGKTESLRHWLRDNPKPELFSENRYANANAILTEMGLAQYHYDNEHKQVHFSHHGEPLTAPGLDLRGYETLTTLHLPGNARQPARLAVDKDNTALTVTWPGEAPLVFPLEAVLQELRSAEPKPETLGGIGLTAQNGKRRVRIHITNISGYFDEADIVHIHNMSILVLSDTR